MIKIYSHIIISLLLLVTTTGMAVSKHFCDELLVSTSFFAETEACCDGDACCHHESEFFQLKDDFQPSMPEKVPASVEIELISYEVMSLTPEDLSSTFHNTFAENKPPSPPKIQTVLSLKQSYLL